MKRKRGKGVYKKGKKVKSEKTVSAHLASPNIEDSGMDQPDDDDLAASENDPEPSSIGECKPQTMSNVEIDLSSYKTDKVGHSRVKVKLKSSKISEPPKSASDVQTISETEKNNPPAILINEATTEKDEITCSDGQTSELHSSASEKLPIKTGSIKIKSSRGLNFSSQTVTDRSVDKLDDSTQAHSGRKLVIADSARTTDSTMLQYLRQKDRKLLSGPLYNEKELSSALTVIKKVMKMEAAVPFNSPVNPVALGIPDYFDIIKTPMDFGTICTNLERQQKYMSSEDVYKDVQYIWDNCYTYNNKGDYIVDLMKRVKKNFMKYWLAAGLYSEPGTSEGIQMDETVRPNTEKSHAKTKSKHKKRRYAMDKHKSDCLCAVCAVRRRRKEREENSTFVNSPADAAQGDFSQPLKLEENSPMDISGSEDVTSSPDHSPVGEANADAEEANNQEKLKSPELDLIDVEKGLFDASRVNSLSSHPLENGAENATKQYGVQDVGRTQAASRVNDTLLWQRKGTVSHQQVKGMHWESSEKSLVVETQEDPKLEENPLLFKISRSLFPSDLISVWNGPHSFSKHTNSTQDTPIHAAVTSLMKL